MELLPIWRRATLTQEEVSCLEKITRNGVRAARSILDARALLLLDRALVRLRERFVKYGVDAALGIKKLPCLQSEKHSADVFLHSSKKAAHNHAKSGAPVLMIIR